MNIIAAPLGWIMKGCYYLVQNYGLALLLFTILVKLITFPLQVKQEKNMAKTQLLAPELEKLKKKYGKNPEKLQEEQMKLYAKSGTSPTAGCLPMLITLAIIWAMIPVVYGPLTYVSGLDKDDVERSNKMIQNLYTVSSEVKSKDTTLEELIKGFEKDDKDPYEELEKLFTEDSDAYPKSVKAFKDSNVNDVIQAIEKHNDIDTFMLDEDNISSSIVSSRPELMTFNIVDKENGKYADILADDIRKKADEFNYEFLGIYLGQKPTWKSLTCLIPIACFIFQILSSLISQHYSKKNNPAAADMGKSMNFMIYGMSLFSLWIGFSYPAGLGLYWTYSSVIGLIQTIILKKIYTPERVAELVQKDLIKNKEKGKTSFMEKMVEANMIQQGKDPNAVKKAIYEEEGEEYVEPKKKSKSELKDEQRKRLNEARKRMAEKYGDEYSDED